MALDCSHVLKVLAARPRKATMPQWQISWIQELLPSDHLPIVPLGSTWQDISSRTRHGFPWSLEDWMGPSIGHGGFLLMEHSIANGGCGWENSTTNGGFYAEFNGCASRTAVYQPEKGRSHMVDALAWKALRTDFIFFPTWRVHMILQCIALSNNDFFKCWQHPLFPFVRQDSNIFLGHFRTIPCWIDPTPSNVFRWKEWKAGLMPTLCHVVMQLIIIHSGLAIISRLVTPTNYTYM